MREPDATQAVTIPNATPRSATSSSQYSSIHEDNGRFLPGTLIAGRYRVIALLGRGGMGEVYRATDLTLGQSVALKFLPEDAARDERLLERFHNEVRVARQVSHPNVCRVYDIGEAEGMPFISMEYVDGEDLAVLLQRIGRLPAQKGLEITRKLCAGLAAAHERGIIHRDLKPHNIMLNRRGEVVIMDFGLAAIAQQIEGLEARNGTPAYMAPEQLRGDSVTAKSDIYSLGLIVFELFTGKRAFDGRTIAEQLKLQESSRPSSLSSTSPDIDPAVDRAIALCLQADPEMRPASALSVAAALPGGDPLAAALAAGETPSPELVAASGKTEGFPLRYSLPCLLVVFAGIVVCPWMSGPASVLANAPMDFPAPVLEQKCREVALAFGFPERPADWFGRFQYATDLDRYLVFHRNGRPWRQLYFAASPVEFFYRQSPQFLLAMPDGLVTPIRPASDVPGMVKMTLDSQAHLRQFEGIVDQQSNASSVEPGNVFALAGLDIKKFEEVPPVYVPLTAFDQRRAWSGQFPGLPGLKIVVTLGTWRGRLTSFFIDWPWRAETAARQNGTSNLALTAVSLLMTGVGLFCVVFFARRNLLAGRGDRKGAWRVGTAGFVLLMIGNLARLHRVPDTEYLGWVWQATGSALLWSILLWLMYIALEPVIRARWPHSLITWNRVLAGQLGDARVGSHILLGVAAGVFESFMFLGRSLWFNAHGGSTNGPDLLMLSGTSFFIRHLTERAFSSLFFGIGVFFTLSGLRVLVRKDWVAAFGAGALMLLVESNIRISENLWIDIPVYLLFYGIFGFLLLRFGLVSGILAVITLNLVGDLAIGSNWNDWFNWINAVTLGLVGSVALYGFWRSRQSAAAVH